MTRPTPAELARLLGDGWDAPARAHDAENGGQRPVTPDAVPTPDAVWAALDGVPDPEVPVISVVELGIVRAVDIAADDGTVRVTITPTYSGCPAMREIERDIRAALAQRGWPNVQIATVYAPAWTTDWMSDAAREKLRAYGIAPPRAGGGAMLVTLRRAPRAGTSAVHVADDRADRWADDVAVPCPRCGSGDTRLQSVFGSTACKALHQCGACGEPFEEFKPI